MLYNLLLPYIHTSHIANLFHYITFRSGISIILSFIISLILGPIIIRRLKQLQKNGQPIRGDGPQTHLAKAGTPTMGGIIIIISVLCSSLLLADLTNPLIWIMLFVLVSLCLLGFMDDYAKVTKNNHKGVKGRSKLILQCLIGVLACLLIQYFEEKNIHSNILSLPFIKNVVINLGMFYLPFAVFVIVGASNAVNLTDGLDGLATVPIIIAAGSFGLITYLVGNVVYAHHLQLIYVPKAAELTIFCASIIGASLGFLWFNAQPAEIFMGDTGSLSLGGALGVISIVTKHEIVLSIIGGLFVVETLSVIIQVYYFKLTKGKRFFRMAPLHHHFEQKGWPESKVVVRFWIVAIVFALIGLSSLKLR